MPVYCTPLLLRTISQLIELLLVFCVAFPALAVSPPSTGNGTYSIPQTPEALKSFLKALHSTARKGDVTSQVSMGWAYYAGDNIPEDAENGSLVDEWVERARLHYPVSAMSSLSDKEAVRWWRRAAQQGSAEAFINLGMMALSGAGMSFSNEQALDWFRKAADRGSVEGIFLTAWMLFWGQGTTPDKDQAFLLWQRAALWDHARAAYELGRLYYKGDIVPLSVNEAERWWLISARKGYHPAQISLADLYLTPGPRYNPQSAVQRLTPLAEAGDPVLQERLGDLYAQGIEGLPRDYSQALYWYQKLLDQDDPFIIRTDFEYRIAQLYEKGGYGLEQSWPEALKWYTQTAENGSSAAMIRLGWANYAGDLLSPEDPSAPWVAAWEQRGRNQYPAVTGLQPDNEDAALWWYKAAEAGAPEAQTNLGVMYLGWSGDVQDHIQAVTWLRRAAEQGYAEGQAFYGWMLLRGQGGAKDVQAAAEWLSKAAVQGYPQAQHELGLLYQTGTGVEKDSELALHWWRKAAEQGLLRSQVSLGVLLLYGDQGIQPQYPEAYRWLYGAVQRGDPDAQFFFGEMLREGLGVTQDEAQAFEWYRKAAEHAQPMALYRIGASYAEGKVVRRSMAEAVEWYRRAAELDVPEAQAALGEAYAHGHGVKRDPEQALAWFLKAARHGVPRAQVGIGMLYEQGEGLPKDYAKAAKWYQAAVRQDEPEAHYRLARLFSAGHGVQRNPAKARALYKKAAALGYKKAKQALISGESESSSAW